MVAVTGSQYDHSVLINGESGVGKKFFSRSYMHFPAGNKQSFYAVNCGAIPEGYVSDSNYSA
jgi:transcriptional regulator with PAS, ATPase and Fis domain